MYSSIYLHNSNYDREISHVALRKTKNNHIGTNHDRTLKEQSHELPAAEKKKFQNATNKKKIFKIK